VAREVRLWEFLRDGLKGVAGLHMRRVENQVSSGDPDVDGCYSGRYFEIELKGLDRPARASTPLDLGIRKSQVIWHRKRVRAGGNIWLYIRVGKDRDLRKYLVPGSLTGILEANPPTEEALEKLAVLPPIHTATQVLSKINGEK
jgi:hypothetical protein